MAWDYPFPSGIPRLADCERRLETQRLQTAVVLPRDLDIHAPVAPRQVGGIDVRDRTSQFNPLLQEKSHGREDPAVDRLVGFVIRHQAKRLGLLSDAGFVTRNVTENLSGLHGLFVEANYDEAMLEADTRRPWPTKQRIRSRHGHLSNTQVMELIREIAHPALARIVLGHLSADCNGPQLALGLLRECLTTLGHAHTQIHCACPHEPTGWFGL